MLDNVWEETVVRGGGTLGRSMLGKKEGRVGVDCKSVRHKVLLPLSPSTGGEGNYKRYSFP